MSCTLSRKLNNEELRSYLHARYSDLGELLLPHADGDLLYLITVKPSRWSDAIATVSGYFFSGGGWAGGGEGGVSACCVREARVRARALAAAAQPWAC